MAADIMDLSETRVPLRNEPVQARSTARLEGLLDAAASIVDEIGFERLTTAMVAERAGASIGTVYRYFPDRIAVLQALGARNLERVLTRVGDEVLRPEHPTWVAALTAAMDILVAAFRTEPGFRGLRVGDAIDLGPSSHDRTFKSILADRMLDGLVERFGIEDSAELRVRFEAVIEVSDALASRAFFSDPAGDERFFQLGYEATTVLLAPYLGDVAI
ncbi:AcrR family transcriptional regulator [Microbacteriaceae bacterium SG_E_30_P1]|uniref:AcrR family transcriptional regulator n=1 Tax=Antiquaquibacter oligotrophicus TaxID=2880260 RepID=A0ABT6KMV4_9MICO|nr:TetR/AcrR family transcriptional regulator [Antiquaquibacter oligotrophicus]MDH6181174.1 AcrR family transcriptional regulator [Antiquaquibacter oligotrophicus]UDF13131.1 TetR family transcriptional regulator [Antiquaquibacter oligotrophicus]